MRRLDAERLAGRIPAHAARIALFLAVVVAAVMAGLASHSYQSVREAERERQRIAEAMQYWVGMQAEIETLRLGFRAGRDAPAAGLPEQYAIFRSRLDLLRSDDLRETLTGSVMARERAAQLEALLAEAEKLDATVLGSDIAYDAKLKAIRAFVRDWNEELSLLARTLFAIESARTQEQNERISSLQARELWNRVTMAAVLLLLGGVLYVAARVSRDMARSSVRQRQRLEQMLDAMPIEVHLFDGEGRILRSNAASRERLAALDLEWRTGETAEDLFRRVARSGRVEAARGRETAWAREQAKAMMDGPERFVRHDCLDGGVWLCQRTANIFGETLLTSIEVTDLIEARDRAEALSAERAEFMAVLGHEMKTPVATLKGALELAARSDDPAEIRRNLGHCRLSLEALLTLSEDLFDYMSLEAGGVRLERVAFDPLAFAQSLRRDYAPRAQARGLDFELRAEGLEGRRILADRVRLRQIADNLLTNALKYTERGGVTLRVALSEERRLTLEVADTGMGVPTAERKRIFNPFMQSSRTRGRLSGVGLGLSICKQLAEAMSGRLTLADRPGGGSVFELGVPVQVLPQEAAPEAEPAPEAAPARRRVLLVEDNAMLAEVTLAQLAAAGHDADHAASLAAAEAACEAERYDAVLLDLGLPDGSGLELARRLAGGGAASAGACVVVLTAYADAARREACLAAGAHDVLRKPFEAEAFRRAVDRHLGGPRTEAEAGRADAAPPQTARMRELEALLGKEALQRHLEELRAAVRRVAADPALSDPSAPRSRREALLEAAHGAAGHARLVGWEDLAEALNRIEARLEAGETPEPGLRDQLAARLADTPAP